MARQFAGWVCLGHKPVWPIPGQQNNKDIYVIRRTDLESPIFFQFLSNSNALSFGSLPQLSVEIVSLRGLRDKFQ